MRRLLLPTLAALALLAPLALAQAPVPTVPEAAPAPVRTGPVGSHTLDYVILAAAGLGAYLKRMSDDSTQTVSWATLGYVLVSSGVTYLALDTGMLPDAWEAAAAANPVKAGVVAFIASNLAGAGLVAGVQGILAKIAPSAPAPPPPATPGP